MTGRPSASLSPRAGTMVKTQAHAPVSVSPSFSRGRRHEASAVGCPVAHLRLHGSKDCRRGKGT
jgi:hypothetical protein